ncbi:hypothetical protein AMK59_4135, partial [Oryctes borbonicus]
ALQLKMPSKRWHLLILILFISSCCVSNARQVPVYTPEIRSDVIVTKYPSPKPITQADEEIPDDPGWMRRTLLKFGRVASNVGNTLGRHSIKVTNAIEKICEIIKTIVPVISAICGVGQFQFCSATNGVSDDLNKAIRPNPNDLNIPD